MRHTLSLALSLTSVTCTQAAANMVQQVAASAVKESFDYVKMLTCGASIISSVWESSSNVQATLLCDSTVHHDLMYH